MMVLFIALLTLFATPCCAEDSMLYEWKDWWRSPKGQPYFDSVLHVNDTGKDLICSVCGSVVHPIRKKVGDGIYTDEGVLKMNPGMKKYEVKTA